MHPDFTVKAQNNELLWIAALRTDLTLLSYIHYCPPPFFFTFLGTGMFFMAFGFPFRVSDLEDYVPEFCPNTNCRRNSEAQI